MNNHPSATALIPKEKDAMGAAILGYAKTGKAGRLRVLSSMFEEDEIPISHLFRTLDGMPELEKEAMRLMQGKVLDIGAGAGCHSIIAKERGLEVTSLDTSPLSCEAMRLRGLADVRCQNIFSEEVTGLYDTILMLMNGTGIAGTISHLPDLLGRVSRLLSEGGCILVDSSDLRYIYENEDGSFDIDLSGPYYGEVDYQMCYKKVKGDPFNWLYVDFPLLRDIARNCGLECVLQKEGPHYDYLARITKR